MSGVRGYDYSFLRTNKVSDLRTVQNVLSLVCLAHFASLIFFFGYVQNSVLMAFGYPAFAVETPPPGDFYNLRFTFKWWVWATFSLRLLVPSLAMFMVPYYTVGSLWKKTLHLTISRISFIYEIAIFIILFVYWCTCNSSFAPVNPCNDARYCCVYYPLHYPLDCVNNVDCAPPVLAGELQPDPLFVVSWAFSGVFVVVSIVHILLNTVYTDISNAFLYTVQPYNPVAGG